ncbi:MAG: nuclease-related domain-containing protein [Cyanobacteria bacterium J06642_11]
MAFCIPTINSFSAGMTPGERRVAERLRRCLDGETILWDEPSIASQCLTPDFVLLYPKRGLLVLEVKDWSVGCIGRATPQTVTLQNPEVELTNPLRQARGYAEVIARVLHTDAALVHPPKADVLQEMGRRYILTKLSDILYSNLKDLMDEFYLGTSIPLTHSLELALANRMYYFVTP